MGSSSEDINARELVVHRNYLVEYRLVGETVEVYLLAGSKYELKASLSGDQTLETSLLPGWKIAVRDLFAE